VGAERLICFLDHDRNIEQWHEALPDENLLLLAADEYRHLSAPFGRLAG
jgi:hypothetical protein